MSASQLSVTVSSGSNPFGFCGTMAQAVSRISGTRFRHESRAFAQSGESKRISTFGILTIVGVEYFSDKLMAHHITVGEFDKGNLINVAENIHGLVKP